MNDAIPTLNPPKSIAEIVQVNREREPEWMMWFPCNEQNLSGCFETWIENHPRQVETIKLSYLDPISEWKRLLEQYVPPLPVNGLALIFHQQQAQIIPLKYKLLRGGISSQSTGWMELWKDLVFEPISRIVELMPTYVRLYEVRHTDPELKIELPVNHQPRCMVLRDFLASLIRQYRREPGPILVRGMGGGLMELDCWILTGYFKIQAIWKLDAELSCGCWWRQMRRLGHVEEWILQWSSEFSTKARKEGKYIEAEKEISSFIKKDRLDTLIISGSESTRTLHELQVKDILLKQLNVHLVEKDYIGAILK